jgi:hypothetical protein
MKYNPFLIALLCIQQYVTEEVFEKIVNELKVKWYFTHQNFVEIVATFFDMQQMTLNPKNPQDVWVYNYLIYKKIKLANMRELMMLYEREMLNPVTSKYAMHLRYKELMDIIRRIKPKPKKKTRKQLAEEKYGKQMGLF